MIHQCNYKVLDLLKVVQSGAPVTVYKGGVLVRCDCGNTFVQLIPARPGL